MKKSEYKFNKNIKNKIESQRKQNEPKFLFDNEPNPIYIPNRKKFKRK